MTPTVRAAMTSSANEHWNTPLEVLDPLKLNWPRITLDPCSNFTSIVNALHTCSGPDIDKDGLLEVWSSYNGLVFINPPYGRKIVPWVKKAAEEASLARSNQTGTEIILLGPARTDTKWFQRHVWRTADAVLLWEGRLTFLGAPNSALFPSFLAYWGHDVPSFVKAYHGKGVFYIK